MLISLFILFAAPIVVLSCGYNGQDSQPWLHNGIDEVLLINLAQNEIYVVTIDKKLIVINSKTGKSREIEAGQGKDILRLGVHPISKNIYLMDLKGPDPGVVIVGKDNSTFKIHYDLDWDTNPIATVPDFVFTDGYTYFSAPMNGYIYCVRDSNFEVVWKRNVGQAFHDGKRRVTPVTAIALSPDRQVIYTAASFFDDHPVLALDALTGEILWEYQHDCYRHIERLIPQSNQVLIPGSNYDVYAKWLNHGEYLHEPGGALIAVSLEGTEMSVQEISDVIFIREFLFDDENRAYLIGSTIIMDNGNPFYNTLSLFALNETGDTLWDTKELNKAYDGVYPEKSNVVFVDNSVFFGTFKGYLIELNREGELMQATHASQILDGTSKIKDTSKSLSILGLQGTELILKFGEYVFTYSIGLTPKNNGEYP